MPREVRVVTTELVDGIALPQAHPGSFTQGESGYTASPVLDPDHVRYGGFATTGYSAVSESPEAGTREDGAGTREESVQGIPPIYMATVDRDTIYPPISMATVDRDTIYGSSDQARPKRYGYSVAKGIPEAPAGLMTPEYRVLVDEACEALRAAEAANKAFNAVRRKISSVVEDYQEGISDPGEYHKSFTITGTTPRNTLVYTRQSRFTMGKRTRLDNLLNVVGADALRLHFTKKHVLNVKEDVEIEEKLWQYIMKKLKSSFGDDFDEYFEPETVLIPGKSVDVMRAGLSPEKKDAFDELVSWNSPGLTLAAGLPDMGVLVRSDSDCDDEPAAVVAETPVDRGENPFTEVPFDFVEDHARNR